MMIIRLRSCWTGAGQCSGSKWLPVGSVSFSTCGPSSLPWCVRSVLKLKMHISTLRSGYNDSWYVAWPKLSYWAKGPPFPIPLPLYHETQPYTTLSIQIWGLSVALVYMLAFTLFYNVKLLLPWRVFYYFFTTTDLEIFVLLTGLKLYHGSWVVLGNKHPAHIDSLIYFRLESAFCKVFPVCVSISWILAFTLSQALSFCTVGP